MSDPKLQEQLTSSFQAIGVDMAAIFAKVGNTGNLQTTAKTMVPAINELLVAVQTLATSSATALANGLQTLRDQIVNGADGAWDTLKEIEDYLLAHPDTSAALMTAINNCVSLGAQSLTLAQKQQVCDNLGIGDPTVSYLAIYNTAKGQ